MLRTYPRQVLLAIGARVGVDVAFYTFVLFITTYIATYLELPRSYALNAVLVAAAVQVFLIPWFGHLSDRFGRRPVYLFGAVGAAVWVFVFFALLDTGSFLLILLATVVSLVFHAAMYGPQASFIAEMFPTRVRYTGASMGYQLAGILGGALAPIISVALLDRFDTSLVVSLYVVLVLAVTTVCVLLSPETSRLDLRADPTGQRDHDPGGLMTTVTIDLNSDLGEGFGAWTLGDDDALLDVVTSANVACGFHAGDPDILRRVCELAAERGVVIGAQVGYRDLHGFGRRAMDVDPATLTNEVIYQIAALDGFARVAGTRVSYVKPHGALYNAVVHHREQATAVVEAIRLYDASLPVMGLPGSLILDVADRGRAAHRHRGVRRPRLHPAGHARATVGAGGAAARPVARRRADGDDGQDGQAAGLRRLGRRGVRQLDLRARRLPRSGGDGCRGATGLVRGRDRRPAVRVVTRHLLPCGEHAVLVELDGLEEVLALDEAVRTAISAGHAAFGDVVDVVPAARTLLLVVHEGTDVAPLRAALAALPVGAAGSRGATRGAHAAAEIAVHYDGPDLDQVCDLTGLDREEVVAAHTRTPWRVAFAGFAPGFAYLTGGDPRLQVPRRAEPRTSVPPGSVALAGGYSAVYPRSSPGGWQLIGHTDVAVWDVDRDPPALLRPGAVVRFVEADRTADR